MTTSKRPLRGIATELRDLLDESEHARDLARDLGRILGQRPRKPSDELDLAENLRHARHDALNLAHNLGRTRIQILNRDEGFRYILGLARTQALDLAKILSHPDAGGPGGIAQDLAWDLARNVAKTWDRAMRIAEDGAGGRGAEAGVSAPGARPLGRVTHALLKGAVGRLPAGEQERYREEWKAEFGDRPRWVRWAHGLRLIFCARATGQALRWRPASGLERQRPW